MRRITLTKPVSLEGGSDAADYRAPNLLQRILSLFKDVRPGSDLSHLKVTNFLSLQVFVFVQLISSSDCFFLINNICYIFFSQNNLKNPLNITNIN